MAEKGRIALLIVVGALACGVSVNATLITNKIPCSNVSFAPNQNWRKIQPQIN